jgi:hypothetical protein
VVLVVELGYGNDQQTVVLARVAVDECRRAVGAATVRTEQFTMETFLKVGHHGFFKS